MAQVWFGLQVLPGFTACMTFVVGQFQSHKPVGYFVRTNGGWRLLAVQIQMAAFLRSLPRFGNFLHRKWSHWVERQQCCVAWRFFIRLLSVALATEHTLTQESMFRIKQKRGEKCKTWRINVPECTWCNMKRGCRTKQTESIPMCLSLEFSNGSRCSNKV